MTSRCLATEGEDNGAKPRGVVGPVDDPPKTSGVAFFSTASSSERRLLLKRLVDAAEDDLGDDEEYHSFEDSDAVAVVGGMAWSLSWDRESRMCLATKVGSAMVAPVAAERSKSESESEGDFTRISFLIA